MTRPILGGVAGFAPATVEKVERLLEVLSVLHDDAFLGGMFVLHGGTALNIFYDQAPRLSVDIDLMFTGAVEVAAMRAQRPAVDRRLRDISYLARVALLKPELRWCEFADPPIAFPVLQRAELVAGKVKAMMERVAARDLYDLYRRSGDSPLLFADPLARAIAVRSICASDPFPFVSDPTLALDRFRDPAPGFAEPLFAMLRAEDTVEYDEMIRAVEAWLAPLSVLNGAEAEFAQRLRDGAEYRPDILFSDWPDVAAQAAVDPVMAWKIRNLRTLLGLE